MKKREMRYDYLRSLAVFAIILVHSVPSQPSNSLEWWVIAGLVPVLLSFVGIYFMLSGLFILSSGTENIPRFYWNRVRAVAVPFVLYSLIYYLYDAWKNPAGTSLATHVVSFIKEIFQGTVPMAEHMWFLYVLMALYVCAPFLARMLSNMKDRELKLFMGIMIAAQALLTYVPALGISLGGSLSYVIFTGWTIYFILGYALKRLCNETNKRLILILGAAGFVLTLVQKKFTPAFTPGIHDLAPSMMAMASAIFLLFEFMREDQPEWFQKAMSFISRHSYCVYLIHYLILHKVVSPRAAAVFSAGHFFVGIILTAGMTFFLSLTAAAAGDVILIFPLQKWMDKWRLIKEKGEETHEKGK